MGSDCWVGGWGGGGTVTMQPQGRVQACAVLHSLRPNHTDNGVSAEVVY